MTKLDIVIPEPEIEPRPRGRSRSQTIPGNFIGAALARMERSKAFSIMLGRLRGSYVRPMAPGSQMPRKPSYLTSKSHSGSSNAPSSGLGQWVGRVEALVTATIVVRIHPAQRKTILKVTITCRYASRNHATSRNLGVAQYRTSAQDQSRLGTCRRITGNREGEVTARIGDNLAASPTYGCRTLARYSAEA